MSALNFLFVLAVIMFSTKFLGLTLRKIGLPQVLGFILAGLLIGPAIWSLFFPGINSDSWNWLLPIKESNELKIFSKIGVIIIMFTAGLETDLKELKKTGLISFLIAIGGVVLPLGLGYLVGVIFLGNEFVLSNVFLGVIMTATSVGITVETLRELGKLKGRVGTTILSAAIIDDVIGIIVLTIVMNLSQGNNIESPVLNFINPNGNIWISILWMFLFFVVAIGGGIFISKYFKRLESRHPKTRRQIIYALATCFFYSFIAEKVFGVANITGAFIAGVLLSSNNRTAEYVNKRVTTNSYLIFGPIFFAHIGISMSFSDFTPTILLFSLTFVVVGILGKIIGCGVIAKASKFSFKDSLTIGVGMIARGEVALIVTTKGIEAGLIDEKYLAVSVMLILVSTILAPILLKILFKHDVNVPTLEESVTPPELLNPTQFDQ